MANRSPPPPVEVCERIMGFLRKDPKSLHSCLLTCRNWFPRAHYHLYTCVRLFTPAGLSLLLQSLHSFPENVQFVHCLRLTGCSYYEHPARQNDSDELMVTAAIRLPRILTSLHKLEIIRLPQNMHPTFPRFLSQFQAMTQLSLESTKFTSFNEFKRLILAFPSLKRLYLLYITWTARRQPIPRPVHHLSHRTRSGPALEHLKFYHDRGSDEKLVDLFSWLLTTATTSTLVELSVGTLYAGSIPTLNDLLSGCRSSLHTLEIYCDDYFQPFDRINLRNHLALRDLRIYDIDVAGFASLLLIALPPLYSLSIRLMSHSGGDHGEASKTVTSALAYGHLRDVEKIRIGLVEIGKGRQRYEFRAVSKLFGPDPLVVFTDYSEDDLQRYIPRLIGRRWIHRLEGLSRRLGYSDGLAMREVEHDGTWTVIYTVSGKEYGRGTSQEALNDAKEIAAYQTFCALVTELCVRSPDEYRLKYGHIFEKTTVVARTREEERYRL